MSYQVPVPGQLQSNRKWDQKTNRTRSMVPPQTELHSSWQHRKNTCFPLDSHYVPNLVISKSSSHKHEEMLHCKAVCAPEAVVKNLSTCSLLKICIHSLRTAYEIFWWKPSLAPPLPHMGIWAPTGTWFVDRKTDSPSLRSHVLWSPSPCWDVDWLDLEQVATVTVSLRVQ